jgi:hypothetical protein
VTVHDLASDGAADYLMMEYAPESHSAS